MIKILFFFGTRPEAIKMAPVIREFLLRPEKFEVKVCVSGQHRKMLDQMLSFFKISPDFDLDIMKQDQDLFSITGGVLEGMKNVMASFRPDWFIVQGDTSTTFAGALAAFYERVRVAHIEAGLRSFNKHLPYPEEMNRLLTTRLADLHFAPTDQAAQNLLADSVKASSIFTVGNTGIDALFFCLSEIEGKTRDDFGPLRSIDLGKKIILVTGHRRESFGRPLENICRALKTIVLQYDVSIVYPVHLNSEVRKPVHDILGGIPNVHLLEPLDYPSFVWLMRESYCILTDSGGIQEEAPSLNKPVLVMRDVTERTEGVAVGTARLVGTKTETIVEEVGRLLSDRNEYERMAGAANPYGDGTAGRKIADILSSL